MMSGLILLLLPEISCPALVAGTEGSLGWALSHPCSCLLLSHTLCRKKPFPLCSRPPPVHKHSPAWSYHLSQFFWLMRPEILCSAPLHGQSICLTVRDLLQH